MQGFGMFLRKRLQLNGGSGNVSGSGVGVLENTGNNIYVDINTNMQDVSESRR